MAIFYVDYENVKNEGLKDIEQLTASDVVNIYYSDKVNTMHIEIVQAVMKSVAKINFIKAEVDYPNALDFQIVSALYFQYSEQEEYFIVSGDKGYDYAIRHTKNMGAEHVHRVKSIANVVKFRAANNSDPIVADEEITERSIIEEQQGILMSAEESIAEQVEEIEQDSIMEEEENPFDDEDSAVREKDNALRLIVQKAIGTPVKGEVALAMAAFKNTDSKQGYYRYFINKLGQKRGCELYNKLKGNYTAMLELR